MTKFNIPGPYSTSRKITARLTHAGVARDVAQAILDAVHHAERLTGRRQHGLRAVVRMHLTQAAILDWNRARIFEGV